MKIVVFGLGSIGKRHIKLLKEGFNHELFIFRSGEKGNEFDLPELYHLDEVSELNPDVAFITNPTSCHLQYALFCAERCIDIFLEKPISHSREKINELVRLAEKNKVTIYTAYCLRFHPVIKWLKDYLSENKVIHASVNSSSYLPNWRSGDHTKNYSAHSSQGGGVILDLSHEIDYLCYLFGEIDEVEGKAGKLANVTVDSEDNADLLLDFESSVKCNLHLNFFSRLNRREIILNLAAKTIIADLISSKVRIIEDEKDEVISLETAKDKMYRDQLHYFFDNLHNPNLMNGLSEASKIFNTIMKIREVVL